MTSSSSWNNWSKSALTEKSVNLFRPKDEADLVRFVHSNSKSSTPKQLRTLSAGHAYADDVFFDLNDQKDVDSTVLIDLQKWNQVVSYYETKVICQPGMQILDLLIFLESKGKTLHNITGCLNLSMGGIVCAASHGSGDQATVAESLRQVKILKSDGTVHQISREKNRDFFLALIGSMGALGILLELEFEVVPIQIMHDQIAYHDSVESCWEEMQSDMKIPNNYSSLFWTPIVNRFTHIQRHVIAGARGLQTPTDKESILGMILDMVEAPGAHIIDSIRSHHFLSAKRTFSLVDIAFNAGMSQLPKQNSLFRLTEPLSRQATGLQSNFEMSEDCEIFFPVEHFPVFLTCLNLLISTILDGSDSQPTIIQGKNVKAAMKVLEPYVEEIEACRNSKALFTQPFLIRYLPATESGVMAPNYQKDVFAISLAWFGHTSDKHFYTRTMDLFIDIAVREFDSRVHLGKYHRVTDALLGQYQDSIVQVKRQINVMDAKGLMQNNFLRNWFMQ